VKARELLKSLGLPVGDLHDLPNSEKRFRGCAATAMGRARSSSPSPRTTPAAPWPPAPRRPCAAGTPQASARREG
jgi:hypothetical protein